MSDPRTLEDKLSALAAMAAGDERRARSWHRVRLALRSAPVRSRRGPSWGWIGLRPLALASVAGAIALGIFLFQPPRAVVAAVHGVVEANVDGRQVSLRAGDQLPAGTRIETSAASWVALRVGDDRFSVDTESVVVLRELSKLPARVVVEQTTGRSWHVPARDPGREYVVHTDSGDAIARGTAFLVVSRPGAAPEVVTVEGTVQVASAAGSALVSAGQLARLTAAPPTVEDAPTTRVEATLTAALRDALGRACGAEAQLPGCVRSGSGFLVLPGVATDLRIRVQAPAAGSVEVLAGGQRTEVKLPGQGTFEIKVDVRKSGTEVRVEVKQEVKEVEDDELEPRPSGTGTPKPSKTPEPSKSPRPSETPEPSETPKPSETPDPSKTPEASKTSETIKQPEPSKSPEPSKTPEAGRTPEPTKANETEKPETPKPSPTASR